MKKFWVISPETPNTCWFDIGVNSKKFSTLADAQAAAKKRSSKDRADVMIFELVSQATFPVGDITIEAVTS